MDVEELLAGPSAAAEAQVWTNGEFPGRQVSGPPPRVTPEKLRSWRAEELARAAVSAMQPDLPPHERHLVVGAGCNSGPGPPGSSSTASRSGSS